MEQAQEELLDTQTKVEVFEKLKREGRMNIQIDEDSFQDDSDIQ